MRNLRLRIQPLFDNHIFIDGSGASLQEIMAANTIIRLSTLPTVELNAGRQSIYTSISL